MKIFQPKVRFCKLTDYKHDVFEKQTEQGKFFIWTKAIQTAIDENDFILCM